MIVCRKVGVDTAQPGMPYTVRGVQTYLRPRVGRTFPLRATGLWPFVQYADGDGTHLAKFELVRQHLESEELVLSFDLPPIHLTRGRFAVLNRGYRLPQLPFTEPGISEFRVRCGANVGVDEIRLEDAP